MGRLRPTPGDKVIVFASWSSDIGPGIEGRMVERMSGEYSIEVTAVCSDVFHKRKIETREMYFSYNQAKAAPPDPPT